MNSVNPNSRETSKQRALRIPLDYYRQSTWLNRTKWLLTLAAVVVTGAYLAWISWPGNETAAQHLSPAPVAAAHAAWEGQCAACHVNYSPLRSDADGIGLLTAAFAKGSSTEGKAHSGAIDSKCVNCHAGPRHHSNQIEAEVEACASCHRDHQGRSANIARVSDSLCISCHENLIDHRKGTSLLTGSAPEHAETVTAFAKGTHPTFRSLTSGDPGNIKFNHALHLMPGQYPSAGDSTDAANKPSAGPKRLQDISERFQPALKQYAGADGVLQLDCSACHQLENPTTGRGATPALGAYMQPIVYEQHCAACHPTDLVIDKIPQRLQGVIPHSLQPAEVRELLLGRLLTDGKAEPLKLSPKNPSDAPAQPIPGKTPGENLAQQLQMSPGELVGYAQTQLASQHKCGKCHHFEDASAEGLMSAIKPSNIPSTWLKHAKFDHAAHRAVNCTECHKVEDAPSEAKLGNALDDTWAMIPSMENCLQCHGPRHQTKNGVVGGARFDCAECHRYHAGDAPPHGSGARERGVESDQRRRISPFISGQAGKAK